MIIKQLGLRNFRNIKTENINLNAGLNIFRGQNGQGKTNLVEALYLLTTGQSFRMGRVQDLSCKNNNLGFFISGTVLKKNLDYNVELNAMHGKKSIKINGKGARTPTLKKYFPSLLFSPESLLIVKDSAQKRRDLIDQLCTSLYPEFGKLHFRFKKILKQKNSLLKKVKEKEQKSSADEKLFNTLSEMLLKIGSELTFFRLMGIEEIEPLLLEEFLQIMDEHYGNIAIDYLISGQSFKGVSKAEILNAMYKRWGELKAREWASGLCLVGPHKHDVQFNFNDQEARFYCSQGQQRAIILAFKMAQTRLHYRAHKEFPVLLLDDVLSELDREKQKRFLNYLLSTEAQILLTTTDATKIPGKVSSTVFFVREGEFVEQEKVLTGGLSV